MKYKVGDRVRVRSDLKEIDDYRVYGVGTNSEMVRVAGEVVTISHVGSSSYRIEEYGYLWTDKMFEGYAGKPSKEELFNMPMGTKIITDKGNEYVYDGKWFTYKETSFSISYFNNDLSFIDVNSKEGVAEIQIPEYKTVWKESRKKMTLKEIEKELGYPVEIVEEEN